MSRGKIKKHALPGIIPNKHGGIEKAVQRFIEEEKYVPTGHAKKRLDQREISIKEVRSALIGGKRDKVYDKYHTHDDKGNLINRWSYAFSKSGLDRRLRVCVSIDETREKPLLIVTVVDIK
jgi:hypothetical protein